MMRGSGWGWGIVVALSLTPLPTAAAVRGDVDCNGVVNSADLSVLIPIVFSDAADHCGTADVNGDSDVSAADIIAITHALGTTHSLTPTATATSTATATRTVMPTPFARGPQITFFGLATASGHRLARIGLDAQSNDILPTCGQPGSCPGAGFIIVVEARAGLSLQGPGIVSFNSNPSDPKARPDLQIEADHDLGNPTKAICDKGPLPTFPLGGVPGIRPISFDPLSQGVADALNDLGCRFDSHTVTDPCTVSDRDNPTFLGPGTTAQFCTTGVVGRELELPNGDTTFAVQWRDTAGNLSAVKRIVVRVP